MQDENGIMTNLKVIRISNDEELDSCEKKYRNTAEDIEGMPWAQNTSYKEIARDIIPDKNGMWFSPLFLSISMHNSTQGMTNLCMHAEEYIKQNLCGMFGNVEILSISACMSAGRISLKVLVRQYNGVFDMSGFFDYIGESIVDEEAIITPTSGKLLIPDEIKNFKYTDEEIKQHDDAFNKQSQIFKNASYDEPFLNSIEEYVPHKLPTPEDHIDLVYDLLTEDKKIKTVMDYNSFNKVFREVLSYVNGVEYYHYVNVMLGEETEAAFMRFLENYIEQNYIKTSKFAPEDMQTMLKKLHRALFEFYIIQDLIDDPMVTDIKITAPDSIRARIKGKAYITNISFIDAKDYIRFVNGIAIKNRIQQVVPTQTFTDKRDDTYINRLSITAQYVTSDDWPYLHIRKVNRTKPLGNELIKLGMLTPKVRDYILDCGRTSRGVVFAGPPGSGKTVCLNWFLEEAYEQSAEILVIQENDELFAYRKGVMFEHVVNYPVGKQRAVNLEQLGQLALVAGANVFIIGEAKGAEICSAITLSNSGCRTAMTIHSPSSTETIDKMADLAMRGYAQDYKDAKRMLRSFQTIVYLEDFKVKEISEITGYNEQTGDMEYRYIYRRDKDPDAENELSPVAEEIANEERLNSQTDAIIANFSNNVDRKEYSERSNAANNVFDNMSFDDIPNNSNNQSNNEDTIIASYF